MCYNYQKLINYTAAICPTTTIILKLVHKSHMKNTTKKTTININSKYLMHRFRRFLSTYQNSMSGSGWVVHPGS